MASQDHNGQEKGLRKAVGFFKTVFKEFGEDRCGSLAASIAYYTAFALPPLLVFIILLLGLVVNAHDVQGMIGRQMQSLLGQQGAQQAQTMIQNANKIHPGSSTIALIVGIAALVFSASGAFLSLQDALNTAWEVRPDPRKGRIRNFLFKRLISLGLIMTIAFLLLVSLVISGLLAAFGDFLGSFLPGGVSGALLMGLNWLISLGVITVLFAVMFKILPDAQIDWKDVWVGALFTALLFSVGKALIGIYLGRSNPGGVFGAAGSFALILIWIYYTSLILLLGAEFTQVWAGWHGKAVEPEPGAVRFRLELLTDQNGHGADTGSSASPPEKRQA